MKQVSCRTAEEEEEIETAALQCPWNAVDIPAVSAASSNEFAVFCMTESGLFLHFEGYSKSCVIGFQGSENLKTPGNFAKGR